MGKNLSDKAISEKDMLEYLKDFSDFSFEMKILKLARNMDLTCEHAGHYEDPVTKKSRQFDIRATYSHNKFRMFLPIECKNIQPNFPLLVSCVPRSESESFFSVAAITDLLHHAAIRRVPLHPFVYRVGHQVGKATAQIGRLKEGGKDGAISAGDSDVYDKWSQSLASANELAGKAVRTMGTHRCQGVLPVLVVPDGTLWTVEYEEDGEMRSAPKLTDHISLFVGMQIETHSGTGLYLTYTISHVEIVTEDGFHKLVKNTLPTIADAMA